jgi:DNA topoisomerase VI subunit B
MTDVSQATAPSPKRTAKRPAPALQRVAFTTSRLAEFCGEKELVAQTGQSKECWPLVILKECVDNALDEAEEAGTAPEVRIEVSTAPGEIVITDNGRTPLHPGR